VTSQPIERAAGRQRLGPDWPYRRQLTTVEAKAGLDPVSLDDEVARIMGDLMQAWPKVAKEWRAQLQQQITEALQAEDPSALTALAVDATRAGDELHAAILDAAAVGVASAVDEADSQGVGLTAQQPADDTLMNQAHTLAAIMAMGYVASAAREAFRLWDTRRDPTDVAGDVAAHLAGLSDTTQRDTFNGAVNGGVNSGRQAVMATAEVPVTFYASEVRDANTCEACAAIDGHQFASQDEADATYPTGGYIDCLGRYRCRGVVIAVYGEDDQEES
jgi:hypothetical protein